MINVLTTHDHVWSTLQNYGYNISRGLQQNYQHYIGYIGLFPAYIF